MTVKNGHLPRGCWANLHFPLKTAFDYRIPEDEVKFISACSQSLFSASSLISGYINIFSFLWSVFGEVFFFLMTKLTLLVWGRTSPFGAVMDSLLLVDDFI